MTSYNEHIKKAKEIIKNNLYVVIATASRSGEPWISPVFFNFDNDFNVYWESSKEAKHSRLIRENPEVALVIFDSRAHEGTGDGLYIVAKAEELEGEALKDGIVRFFGGRFEKTSSARKKQFEDYIDDKPLRIYRAKPQKIYKLTDGIRLDGYYVDKKIELSIEDLTS